MNKNQQQRTTAKLVPVIVGGSPLKANPADYKATRTLSR